jgi:WD40-like Beta Propeller Repeat
MMTRALVGVCTFAVSLAFAAGLADAAVTHDFLPEPSKKISEGVPEGAGVLVTGPLSGVNSLTVDEGHLWIAERFEGQGGPGKESRVDAFDAATGSFLLPQLNETSSLGALAEGIAVGHSNLETDVYVGTRDRATFNGVVAVFTPAGSLQATWTGADTPSKSFDEFGVSDVAVNNRAFGDWPAGDVYVVNSHEGVVDVFKPEAGGQEPPELAAELTGTGPGAPFISPTRVAVDRASGEVLVVDQTVVDIFKPAALPGQYEFVRQLTGTPGHPFERLAGVGVDNGTGDTYVLEERFNGKGEGESVIDEFSIAGAYRGSIIGTPAAPFGLAQHVQSISVDEASHNLYVGVYDPAANVGAIDVFGPDIVIPDVTVSEPVLNPKPTSVTLRGTVNPEEAGEATCEFEYGTSTSYGQHANCTGPVANGGSPVEVQSDEVTGLQPDTTYHYRLDATNVANAHTNTGECPEDCGEFTTPGPGIHEESVTDLAATSATLHAAIDPHGADTTYYFQYGRSAEYESEVPLAPGAAIGSGEGDVAVEQHVQALSAGTVYHYRVVAVSELEVEPGVPTPVTFGGPDQTFTTQGAGGSALPDGRGWEMVSPPDKHGALIEGIGTEGLAGGGVVQAAAGGGAISYLASQPTESEPPGYDNQLQVLSYRTPSGWSSADISPAHEVATTVSVGLGNEYRAFSEDLSLAGVQPFGAFIPSSSPLALAPSEASEQTAFVRTNFLQGDVQKPCSASCYRPLVTGCPPLGQTCRPSIEAHANVPPGTVFGQLGHYPGEEELKPCPPAVICGPEFVGATPDMSHVVLGSPAALTSVPVSSLVEWSGGQLVLINVLPEGEGGGPAGNGQLGSTEGNTRSARHAISNDGSRVFWSGGSPVHLYMRDVSRGETVRLDQVRSGTGNGPANAVFQTASSDGSKAFFTDTQELTANAGKGNSDKGDLYECEIVEEAGKPSCKLSDLTPETSGEPARVQGEVLGASEDGSWVYFVANGALAPGAVRASRTCTQVEAPAGATCNLYVSHDGSTRLIAVISAKDSPDLASSPPALTARVSPDGQWLAFMSQRELTGYNNRDAITGKPDEEAYLYDAESNRLVCASCNPTGARPLGKVLSTEETLLGTVAGPDWDHGTSLAAALPGWTPYQAHNAFYQSRYLSNSGRLFFNSRDALVPQDVNGTWDVYEFEPSGIGGCSSAGVGFSDRIGGCVGLVSSGESPLESAFLDASETGGDVFFLTTGQLLKQDHDSAYDVYDARECTTQAPCIAAPGEQPPPCDTEASCKPPPSLQPSIFGPSGSATFFGPPNPAPPAVKPPSKRLTRAQLLAKALKACRRKHNRHKRATCEAQARRRYGKAPKTDHKPRSKR